MTLRLGIIGCGNIALAHGFSLKAIIEAGLADAQVVATTDADAGRASRHAELHGADALPDAAAVLDRVDAVWICTPTSSHLGLVEAAASRGVAVFCEKPLAPALAGAEAMAAVAANAGIPNQVGLVLRTSPVFVALRDLLAGGALGPVMTAVFRDDQFFPIRGGYNSTWRRDVSIAGAGTLLEHSIHDVDILRVCLGEIDAVSGRIANFAGHDGVEDLAVLQLSFASGALATLTSVWHEIGSRPSTRRVEVFCRDGLAWLDDDFAGPLHVETEGGHEVLACPQPEWVETLPGLEAPGFMVVKHYAAANRAFLDALAAGSAPEPGFAEGVIAHRLVDAAYESARRGGEPVSTRC